MKLKMIYHVCILIQARDLNTIGFRFRNSFFDFFWFKRHVPWSKCQQLSLIKLNLLNQAEIRLFLFSKTLRESYTEFCWSNVLIFQLMP